MSSVRLSQIVVALTVAAFPVAVANGVLWHANRLGLGVGMIVIAALLAVPSSLAALLVGRRRPEGWLPPMLALTGFLPALALLGAVLQEGPASSYAVPLSQGSWVLLFVSAALLVLFFPEGRVRGRDRWLAWAIAISSGRCRMRSRSRSSRSPCPASSSRSCSRSRRSCVATGAPALSCAGR